MIRPIDQDYLKDDQYKTSSNLTVRMALHARFGTNKTPWHLWVFDQLDLPSNARVLELGCGPGSLWVQNALRIPPGWTITLTDLSPGMLAEARRNLADVDHAFDFREADAQSPPFPDASFDAVIANHMLYHVPDRSKAYAEIERILAQNGRLFAATNGRGNLERLYEIQSEAGLGDAVRFSACDPGFFDLETGEEELRHCFDDIVVQRLLDTLVVTETQPLVDYILTSADRNKIDAEMIPRLRSIIETEIREQGAVRIEKVAGLIYGRNR